MNHRGMPPRDERMTVWEIAVLEAAELVAKRMPGQKTGKRDGRWVAIHTPKCVRALIDKVEEGDPDA